jgi:hypothetical protein
MAQSQVQATTADTLMNIEELKELIVHNLDITEFFDIIGLDLSDFIDKFDEEVMDFFVELKRAVA